LSAAQLLLRYSLGEAAAAAPFQVTFHTQQGAGKALKGALTYGCIRFEPTHRLNLLAALLPLDWEATMIA